MRTPKLIIPILTGFLALTAVAAEEVDHPDTDGAELRYKGAPIPASEVRIRITPGAPNLTDAEFKRSSQIFFERCAGCHGDHSRSQEQEPRAHSQKRQSEPTARAYRESPHPEPESTLRVHFH